LEEGLTLEDYLDVEDFNKLVQVLELYPFIAYSTIATYRPAVAFSLILEAAIRRIGFSHHLGIDWHVYNFALINEKPTLGLTGYNEHYSYMLDIPKEVALGWLHDFYDSETFMESLQELFYLYENQNIDGLRQTMTIDIAEYQNMFSRGEITAEQLISVKHSYEVTSNHRSSLMAHEIERLLRETEEATVFFITVGISHLLHDNNVLNTLSGLGLTLLVYIDKQICSYEKVEGYV